jgi:hypothetical protein
VLLRKSPLLRTDPPSYSTLSLASFSLLYLWSQNLSRIDADLDSAQQISDSPTPATRTSRRRHPANSRRRCGFLLLLLLLLSYHLHRNPESSTCLASFRLSTILSAHSGEYTDHKEVRHGSRIRMQAFASEVGNLLGQQWLGEGTSQLGSMTRQHREEAEQGE